jgi:hypothetical protein
MNDDKWGELLDRIQDQFGVLEEGSEQLDDVPNGKREFVIFNGPMGKMMLERLTTPRVVGEKSFGGSKYGTGSGVEKIYSPDETVKTMRAYRDDGGEWMEMDKNAFGE